VVNLGRAICESQRLVDVDVLYDGDVQKGRVDAKLKELMEVTRARMTRRLAMQVAG
jgi:hypothetical protein